MNPRMIFLTDHQMTHAEKIDVCPDCYAVVRHAGPKCPACGADAQRRETLDRATLLILVLTSFGLAWSFLTP